MNKNNLLIVLLFSLASNNIISQNTINAECGLGFGPETFISLTKVTVVKEKGSFYFGGFISPFLFQLFTISGGPVVGLKYKFLFAETTLSYSYIDLPDGGTRIDKQTWLTVNPKIGVKIGSVKLRFGPSYYLINPVDLKNLSNYNFEVSFKTPID
jgi:hypothetical protein